MDDEMNYNRLEVQAKSEPGNHNEDEEATSAETLIKLNNSATSGSQEKLVEILRYLDEVEKEAEGQANTKTAAKCATEIGMGRGVGNSSSGGSSKRLTSSSGMSGKVEETQSPKSTSTRNSSHASLRQGPEDKENKRGGGNGGLGSRSSSVRKFVWEELDGEEEDGSTILPITARSCTSLSVASGPLSEDEGSVCLSYSCSEGDGQEVQSLYSHVRHKTDAMHKELQQRHAQVKELQATLARKREAYHRAKHSLEQAWKGRLRKCRKEQGQSSSEHKALVDQLTTDLAALGKRCQDLDTQLRQVQGKREEEVKLCRALVVGELKRAREQWAAGERARLNKLSASKAEEIKAQTIKSLEPDLHRLISGNKQELKRRRGECARALTELKSNLERAHTQHTHELQKVVDRECEESVTALQAQHDAQLKELQQQQQQELKAAREETRVELEREGVRAEAERKRMEHAHTAQIETLHTELQERMRVVSEGHDKALLEATLAQTRESDEARRRALLDTQQWKPTVLARLQQDLQIHKDQLLANLRRQHAQELDRVLSKLKDEQRNEHAALEARYEEDMARVRGEHKQDMDRLQAQRQAASEKVRRVVKSREEKESMAAKLQEDVENKVEARIEEIGQLLASERRGARLTQDRDRDKIRHRSEEVEVHMRAMAEEVAAFKDHVDATSLRAAELKAKVGAEVAEYVHEKQGEVMAVQDKIDAIVTRKTDLLTSLQSQLTSLLALHKTKEAELEKARYEFLNAP